MCARHAKTCLIASVYLRNVSTHQVCHNTQVHSVDMCCMAFMLGKVRIWKYLTWMFAKQRRKIWCNYKWFISPFLCSYYTLVFIINIYEEKGGTNCSNYFSLHKFSLSSASAHQTCSEHSHIFHCVCGSQQLLLFLIIKQKLYIKMLKKGLVLGISSYILSWKGPFFTN